MFDALMSIAWRVTYSISTFTLKNRWAAFVGHTHAAFTGFVLPRTVYTRISRGGIEDAAECAGFVETARPLGSFVDVFLVRLFHSISFPQSPSNPSI